MWTYHNSSCKQLFWQYYVLNFMISWIQSIYELYHFNHLNSSIMLYLSFKLWTYNSTYSTCLLNCSFIMIMCVINVILSLKFFKIMLYSNFCVFRHYFYTYLVSIMFVDLHLLLIRVCILTHFFLNCTLSVKLKNVWFL